MWKRYCRRCHCIIFLEVEIDMHLTFGKQKKDRSINLDHLGVKLDDLSCQVGGKMCVDKAVFNLCEFSSYFFKETYIGCAAFVFHNDD